MMQYKVITDATRAGLESQIAELAAQRWELVGEVAVVCHVPCFQTVCSHTEDHWIATLSKKS